MHFSKIIKLQFWEKMPYITLYFSAFRIIVAYLSLKRSVDIPNFLFGFQ